ncbi:hypothetical protein H696_00909 [Fonticula alba]|uniref:XPA C-terminal domain-containing protein n=1 Tax=Fonticula alba TaxID=691883 RepID=A0A058ZG49_FONAL|nr:hypothetical protein H696_00909 [Fonticula alba]KCV73370.1 hypothetical protein H696_00909 [Fonticula alba]|eukprot:XP_009493071.1 hypothetical protein H696_00909 [Fonticula alba]
MDQVESALGLSVDIDGNVVPVREKTPQVRRVGARCAHCSSPRVSDILSRWFELIVCTGCVRARPELYSLHSKTAAKEEYLLADEDLSELPFMMRANSRHPSWAPVQLFLAKHLHIQALRKHGGTEESLMQAFEERERRRTLLRQSRGRLPQRLHFTQDVDLSGTESAPPADLLSDPLEHRHDWREETSIDGETAVVCSTCRVPASGHVRRRSPSPGPGSPPDRKRANRRGQAAQPTWTRGSEAALVSPGPAAAEAPGAPLFGHFDLSSGSDTD